VVAVTVGLHRWPARITVALRFRRRRPKFTTVKMSNKMSSNTYMDDMFRRQCL
jgi:hypothetical protein